MPKMGWVINSGSMNNLPRRLEKFTGSRSTRPILSIPVAVKLKETGDPRPPILITKTEEDLMIYCLCKPVSGMSVPCEYRLSSSSNKFAKSSKSFDIYLFLSIPYASKKAIPSCKSCGKSVNVFASIEMIPV
jgi:hypothetical protein